MMSCPRVGDHRQRLDVHPDMVYGCPRLRFRLRHHERYGLPLKMHLALRQQRLVGDDAANLVLAGDVFVGENAHDAGLLRRFSGVYFFDVPMRQRGAENGGIQGATQHGEVIHVEGFAGDVGGGVEGGEGCCFMFDSSFHLRNF